VKSGTVARDSAIRRRSPAASATAPPREPRPWPCRSRGSAAPRGRASREARRERPFSRSERAAGAPSRRPPRLGLHDPPTRPGPAQRADSTPASRAMRRATGDALTRSAIVGRRFGHRGRSREAPLWSGHGAAGSGARTVPGGGSCRLFDRSRGILLRFRGAAGASAGAPPAPFSAQSPSRSEACPLSAATTR
jgi:hypothetical protein